MSIIPRYLKVDGLDKIEKTKIELAEEAKIQLVAYLAGGGTITQIPRGASGASDLKSQDTVLNPRLRRAVRQKQGDSAIDKATLRGRL